MCAENLSASYSECLFRALERPKGMKAEPFGNSPEGVRSGGGVLSGGSKFGITRWLNLLFKSISEAAVVHKTDAKKGTFPMEQMALLELVVSGMIQPPSPSQMVHQVCIPSSRANSKVFLNGGWLDKTEEAPLHPPFPVSQPICAICKNGPLRLKMSRFPISMAITGRLRF